MARSKKKKARSKSRRKKKPSKKKRHRAKKVAKVQPKIGSKDFAALQAKWYAKLADSGFEDIEWSDSKTGFGQGTPYLANSGFGKVYKPETEQYFRLVTNYVTHHELQLEQDRQKRYILQLHQDGVSYRDIVKLYNKRFKKKRSLFFIFYKLRQYRDEIMQWNKTSEHGIYASQDDALGSTLMQAEKPTYKQ